MTYPKKQAEAQMIFRKTGGFVQGNMTLRDYFAAKAMQGLCVNSVVSQDMAKAAYAMADAMLKEREK